VAVLHVAVADLDRVDRSNRPDRPGNRLRRGRRPQRPELAVEGEHPNGVAIAAALELIAAGGNGDELSPVHLVDHGRRAGAESGREAPTPLAGLAVEREEVAVGLAGEDKPAGGHARSAAAADAVRRLVLPSDLVGLAVDRREGTAHRRSDRRRLGAADVAL